LATDKIEKDTFVSNITWKKALKKYNINSDPPPTQIAIIDKLERGLALVLVLSYGGTKTFHALTYVDGKPHTHKLGSYPAMSVKEARAAAHAYWENPKKFEEQVSRGIFCFPTSGKHRSSTFARSRVWTAGGFHRRVA
jgi:hypothetical protein